MVFEAFAALVGFMAVVYAGIAKFVQGKLVDRKEMEDIQAESKRLNEEFKRAQKANDQKRMDKVMAQQMEFLPRMNKVMFKQFRPMFAIIIVFGAFMWMVNEIDPFTKDDFVLNLTDDGSGCDAIAGDNVFTGCYLLENGTPGKWTVHARALEGGSEIASNETMFMLLPGGEHDDYVEAGKGEGLELGTDKEAYSPGDTVVITATPANMTKGMDFIIQLAAPRKISVDQMTARLSSGTYFRVDLPIAIPILNIKSFYQPYWWFIFISLIVNLGASFVLKQFNKAKGGAGKAGGAEGAK